MRNKLYTKEKHMIASEAANLIVAKGLSFEAAKLEACRKLNITSKKKIPRDAEIEALLIERSELFNYKNIKDETSLKNVYETTIKAMELFSKFHPKATGAVLTNIFHQNSSIELHLFADTIEDVERLLINRSIQFELIDRKYKVAKGSWDTFYSISFFAGENNIKSVIFLNDSPYKNIIGTESETPLQRVSLKQFLEKTGLS